MSDQFVVDEYELRFVRDFNDVITPEMFQGLDISSIHFNHSYNIPIPPNVFPDTIEYIEFGNSFNQVILPGTFPQELEYVRFGKSFNKPITGIIPDSVDTIAFGDDFNTRIKPGDLNSASTIYFGKSFNQVIRGVFKEGVKRIKFGTGFNQKLKSEYFPTSIMTVAIEGRFTLNYRNGNAYFPDGSTVPLDEFWEDYDDDDDSDNDSDEDSDEDEDELRDDLVFGSTYIGFDDRSKYMISEDDRDIPEEAWSEIEELFEREFGNNKMTPFELTAFMENIWVELLESPIYRPVWADRIHNLVRKYTNIQLLSQYVVYNDMMFTGSIPDLQIYNILVNASRKYKKKTVRDIDSVLDKMQPIRKWSFHNYELARALFLISYSFQLSMGDKKILRRYLTNILKMFRRDFTGRVTYMGSETSIKLTFEKITVGDSLNIKIEDITNTGVEGDTWYVINTGDNIHKLDFEDLALREEFVSMVESILTGLVLLKHPKLSIPLSLFRRLPRGIITSYFRKNFGKVYERYAPETPYVRPAEFRLPAAIEELINRNETVLSGGRLLRMILGGEFTKSDQKSPLAEMFNSYTGIDIGSDNDNVQDYDLYTTRSMEDIYEYLTDRGYEFIAADPNLAELIMSYGGWLTRYEGPNGERVDVIHVRQHVVFNRPICERPQDFIAREFDIDIIKIWYDGVNVNFMNEKTYQNILDRKMTLDFHPMMSVNQYKTRTTVGRIMKYEQRGFMFVESDNKEMIEKFTDRLVRVALLARRNEMEFSGEMLSQMIERFEPQIRQKKDQIMAYDKYYVKVREDSIRFGNEIPETPLVERPEEHLFLARVLRRHSDKAVAFDDFFKRTLGITVYDFTGGFYGTFITRVTETWEPYLHHISPAFLLGSIDLRGLNALYRWDEPEFETPRCAEVFRVGGANPEGVFKDKIEEYKMKCKDMEEIQNCRNYIADVSEYINTLAFVNRNIRGRIGINVTRGDELLSALENIKNMDIPFGKFFVKYSGERGIDAGGPAKDFLMAVVRQIRPLFEYVNLETEDKRMYISSAPDEDIIEAINENLITKRLTTGDLPELYKLAGVICKSAVINGYSTEIPLSRVLLTIMTSGDMGIDVDAVTSAFILEGKYKLDDYINLENDVYEGFIEESALEKYLISNEPKRAYIDMFAKGFSKMSQILRFMKVAAHELFVAICGSKITIESFESFLTNRASVKFGYSEPVFSVIKDERGLVHYVNVVSLASNVLMRGEEYTFTSEDLDMYITDKLDSSVPSVYVLLGREFVFKVPDDAPKTLYLKVPGISSYIEFRVINSVSYDTLRLKFINYLIGKIREESFLTRVREILTDKLSQGDEMVKRMLEAMGAPTESNLVTDDQLITLYYQLFVSYVTSFNVVGSDTKIKILFTHELVQINPHTCFSTLDISTGWFASSSFEDWLDVVVPAFFERTFSAA